MELPQSNKDLLANFFNGTLIDLKSNKAPVFSVSLWNGMLSFSTQNDAKNYLAALEILKDRWDYKTEWKKKDDTNSNPSKNANTAEGYFETFENIGDDVRNAVDRAIGFLSLRRYYDELSWDNENWKNNVSYIADPALQTVFSSLGEVVIQGKIYHFVDKSLIALIDNMDMETLANVRLNGFAAVASLFTKFSQPFVSNISFYEPQIIESGTSYNNN